MPEAATTGPRPGAAPLAFHSVFPAHRCKGCCREIHTPTWSKEKDMKSAADPVLPQGRNVPGTSLWSWAGLTTGEQLLYPHTHTTWTQQERQVLLPGFISYPQRQQAISQNPHRELKQGWSQTASWPYSQGSPRRESWKQTHSTTHVEYNVSPKARSWGCVGHT